jgi:hypothetical protein
MLPPEKFLHTVWKFQRRGVRFTAVKGGRFKERALEQGGPPSIEDNMYFCPHVFDGSRRRSDNGGHPKATRWLHADLDEVDPRTIELKPTIAWETSPGRYQALWLLSEAVHESRFHDLNQRLTYYVGADKGGWSITKYLRVPGTRNLKYDSAPVVRLLWVKNHVYSPEQFDIYLPTVADPVPANSERLNSAAIVKRLDLPSNVRAMLRARKAVEGQRSERLWAITLACLEAGATDDECLCVLQDTVWNKWAGFTNEERQLRNEIARAHKHLERVAHRRQVNGIRVDVPEGSLLVNPRRTSP